MKRITLKKILDTLKRGAFQFKWKVNKEGCLRAKLPGNSTCYCPLGVYIKLEHNLDITSDSVQEFCEMNINMEDDLIFALMNAADDDHEKEYFEDPQDELEVIHNKEVAAGTKLRAELLNITGVN